MRAIDERYQQDAVFKKLVDNIYHMIETLQTTPTEIREACMMAQLHYEMRHVMPIVISDDLRRQLHLEYHGVKGSGNG